MTPVEVETINNLLCSIANDNGMDVGVPAEQTSWIVCGSLRYTVMMRGDSKNGATSIGRVGSIELSRAIGDLKFGDYLGLRDLITASLLRAKQELLANMAKLRCPIRWSTEGELKSQAEAMGLQVISDPDGNILFRDREGNGWNYSARLISNGVEATGWLEDWASDRRPSDGIRSEIDRSLRYLKIQAMTIAEVARSSPAPMTHTGTFRVHFNRHGAAPLVWCVATDDFELAVANLEITAPLRAVYAPKATPDAEDGKPSAWLEVTGTLTVVGGLARIAPGEVT